jgi:hypothetical protein
MRDGLSSDSCPTTNGRVGELNSSRIASIRAMTLGVYVLHLEMSASPWCHATPFSVPNRSARLVCRTASSKYSVPGAHNAIPVPPRALTTSPISRPPDAWASTRANVYPGFSFWSERVFRTVEYRLSGFPAGLHSSPDSPV